MTARSGAPRLVVDGTATTLHRIDLTETTIDEYWLQKLLDENPDLLPLSEIAGSWGPLTSLGREISTEAGPIDNLFISPTGDITVVEAKLWRNPEARRKVIGQVLDYASQLAKLSYDDFQEAVVGNSLSATSIWQVVADTWPETDQSAEAAFVDAVTENLRTGRFLLLVVGDGIRSGIEALAELVGSHPTLGFHLELIELQLYEFEEKILVVPSIVGRTNEVSRAIVEVHVAEEGNVTVEVVAKADEATTSSKGTKLASRDEFVQMAIDRTGEDWATHTERLLDWWLAEGGTFVLNQQSYGFYFTLPNGTNVSAMACYAYGTAEFQNAALATAYPEFAAQKLGATLKAKDFGGVKRVNYRSYELNPDKELAIRQALTMIKEAFATPGHPEATA